jgi:hypothetical protein
MGQARGFGSIAIVTASVTLLAMAACGGTPANGFLGDSGGPGEDTGGHATDGGATMGHDGGGVIPPGTDGGGSGGKDATSHDTGTGVGHDGGTGVDSGHDAGTTSHDTGAVDAVVVQHDSGLPQVAIVYGQSATTLYAVDPTTNAVTTVGDFGGCDEVIDIALNKDSVMYATSASGVWTVDTSNAACTLIALGTYPNSLSFVPAGTLNPTEESLVGYNGSDYVSIDTTTGAVTTVATNALGTTYASSGDIVSVIGGGTYLTVTGGSTCSSNDCLIEVNPTTGALIKNYGSVQHSAVYGLAFWAGNVYGFDDAGDLFEVTFPDAGGLGITTIPIPSTPSGLSFYGAGSTTAAPKH